MEISRKSKAIIEWFALFLQDPFSGFYLLNHGHQIMPCDYQLIGILIKRGQSNTAWFQFLVIDYQAGIFHMKNLDDGLSSIDEDKDSALANISIHLIIYYPTQGKEAFAHIYREGVQIVLKGLMKMEHGNQSPRWIRARRWARSISFLIRKAVPLG